MSIVSLNSEDLAELVKIARDLNFDDDERRNALLESGSRDFNAVPGSGKTSLLAAKLMLLAKKWPHTRRGICILSHTNVARDEIARRLADTPEGAKLLSYPHFIGTIHSFVNQFFAIPMLRSMGKKIDVIDDQVFTDKAMALLQHRMFGALRSYLDRQNNGDAIVSTLHYRTAELEVHVERGKLPGTATQSYKALVKLKNILAEAGCFRHRDMFAYASLAFKTCPHLVEVVHRRFPMVFIDEMQDTSWEQEALLNHIFDGKSVMQRFGDIDQKILSDEENIDQLTFPRAGYGCISTSKRFGKDIADAVGKVRGSGDPVVGEGANSHPPILLLYATADTTKVIPHFGRMVMNRLTAEDIGDREVKVMCARKAGDGNVDAGRHLLDYWPVFGGVQQSAGRRSECFWSLIGNAKGALQEASLSTRVTDVRRALLLVLREGKAPLAQDIRDARALPRAAKAVTPNGPIEILTRQLVLTGELLCAEDKRDVLLQLLHSGLKPYLPDALDFDTFKGLNVFVEPGESPGVSPVVSTTNQGREIDLGVGTVAGMKGETHAASLVLESYGGSSRKFDVALGLEYITGLASKDLRRLPKTQLAQMRNLYVAMSRPTALLCLAANESRVSVELRNALIAKGWNIETVN
ncbi:UvrD-helicase domain-containing protein [Aeromonas salmonicida]|uniref:UvrD-helicase domain-containing protein n=1 Tax=Aeromonas salmonicida TaxID=645 RepID=UPI001F473B80|nr:UvrD-helicase domain-containing protein [Aeromonas salmonicida]MCE9934788.1 UvrD-helicase domain-containing protein [Aeromonas salmonicida]